MKGALSKLNRSRNVNSIRLPGLAFQPESPGEDRREAQTQRIFYENSSSEFRF